MTPIYVPKYLDEPPKFLVWTYPQLMMVGGPFVMGLIFKHILLGLIGCVVMGYGLRKLQQTFKGTHFMSVLYWHLPHTTRFLPPSHIREFLG